METNKEYFEKQIKGLIMILSDGGRIEKFIARSYVIEKLNMILKGGINFHPSIEEKINKEFDKWNLITDNKLDDLTYEEIEDNIKKMQEKLKEYDEAEK